MIFGDKNVQDIKDCNAVDSDEEAPFGPDYKCVKTTAPPPPSPPPPPLPQPSAAVAGTGPPRPTRRAKRVPNLKPTLLEKALASVQSDMAHKLADLLFYVAEHPNVLSVELQVLS